LEEDMERRRVMILPIKVGHSIVKPRGIICPLTDVENVIFTRMFFIHEFLNLKKDNDDINEYGDTVAKAIRDEKKIYGTYIFNVISPITRESRCWKAHDDYPVTTYVTQIDVVLIRYISFSFSRDKFFNEHFLFIFNI
tara:strand:+ start:568 stop:981 length:414 start_codon:yes stop_codon:yes gene_type:complete